MNLKKKYTRAIGYSRAQEAVATRPSIAALAGAAGTNKHSAPRWVEVRLNSAHDHHFIKKADVERALESLGLIIKGGSRPQLKHEGQSMGAEYSQNRINITGSDRRVGGGRRGKGIIMMCGVPVLGIIRINIY